MPASATANNLVLNGGTLNVGASMTVSANRGIGLGPTGGSTGGGGAINVPAGMALTYNGAIATAGNTGVNTLSLTGPGTVTLGGNSTNTGVLNLNAGTLNANGSLNFSTVNVNAGLLAANGTLVSTGTVNLAAGTTLNGTGSLGNAVVYAGALVNVSANGTSPLTFSSLNFSGGTIHYGAVPSATPPLNVTSAGGLSASNPVVINIDGLSATTGTYGLIAFNGSIGGAGSADFTLGTVPHAGPRQTASLVDTGSELAWIIQGGNPIWTGSNGSAWSGGMNWALSTNGQATDYIEGDNVIFNDIGAPSGSGSGSTTISILGSGNVNPTTVNFNNNATNYTLNGTYGITGSATLAMNGSGSLTITNSNGYTGGTLLNAGLLCLNNAPAIGTGPLTIAGGTLDNTSGTAIALSANNAQNWNANVNFNGTNSLNLGTGPVTLGANVQVNVANNNLTVGGPISGGFGLAKAGSGTLTLTGSSNYSGGATLSAGVLQVGNNAALGSGSLALAGGALTSNGTASYTLANPLDISGNVTLGDPVNNGALAFTANSGTLAATPTLTVNSPVAISSGLAGASGLTVAGPAALDARRQQHVHRRDHDQRRHCADRRRRRQRFVGGRGDHRSQRHAGLRPRQHGHAGHGLQHRRDYRQRKPRASGQRPAGPQRGQYVLRQHDRQRRHAGRPVGRRRHVEHLQWHLRHDREQRHARVDADRRRRSVFQSDRHRQRTDHPAIHGEQLHQLEFRRALLRRRRFDRAEHRSKHRIGLRKPSGAEWQCRRCYHQQPGRRKRHIEHRQQQRQRHVLRTDYLCQRDRALGQDRQRH